MRQKIRVLVIPVGIILAALFFLDISLAVFPRIRRQSPLVRWKIDAIVREYDGALGQSKPIYIPHPYFGFIYTPNNEFLQKTMLKTNSEGFVDEEFPLRKEKDVVVIGLIGGSGAMSWGVEKNEERIHFQLQKLLNDEAKRAGSPKRYRVLNMGVGSYIQYQASQTFFYYDYLLDGVIVYSGHNEIAHGIAVTKDVPVQYPWVDVITALQIESPIKLRIYYVKNELCETAKHLKNHLFLLSSNLLTCFYKIKIRWLEEKLKTLNHALVDQASQQGEAMPHIRNALRSVLPPYNALKFFFSNDAESVAIQNKVMGAIVPLIYTNPILQAYAVAKNKGIVFVNVIQPLMLTVDRRLMPEELANTKATPYFEETGLKILRDQAKELARYGVVSYDFNQGHLFRDVPEPVFIDPAHLTAAGNQVVAENLFKILTATWFEKNSQSEASSSLIVQP